MGICVSRRAAQSWPLKLRGPEPIQLLSSLLAAEIEHVSNLFQEKQAELQSAVLRVDQVIRTPSSEGNSLGI